MSELKFSVSHYKSMRDKLLMRGVEKLKTWFITFKASRRDWKTLFELDRASWGCFVGAGSLRTEEKPWWAESDVDSFTFLLFHITSSIQLFMPPVQEKKSFCVRILFGSLKNTKASGRSVISNKWPRERFVWSPEEQFSVPCLFQGWLGLNLKLLRLFDKYVFYYDTTYVKPLCSLCVRGWRGVWSRGSK